MSDIWDFSAVEVTAFGRVGHVGVAWIGTPGNLGMLQMFSILGVVTWGIQTNKTRCAQDLHTLLALRILYFNKNKNLSQCSRGIVHGGGGQLSSQGCFSVS
jgi:hypothetical protein